eukprot:symbB.v1.2.006420.t1/scaffold383.1/size215797/2
MFCPSAGPGASLKLISPEVGRGVVVCAGGPYTQLALITLRLLRDLCDLPIEVWYLPEEAKEMHEEKLWPSNTVLREIPISLPRRRPDIWAVKPLALLYSGFREVLLMDADNLPAVSPEQLFDTPQYLQSGALFWPDFGPFQEKTPEQWLVLSGGLWKERPSSIRWEQESGQLLVDKSKCGPMLQRAATMAMHLRELSPYLPGDGGDKDLFQLAWALGGQSATWCPMPAAAGCLTPQRAHTVHGPFVGHAMVHHSYDGVPCFLHRTIDKHEDPWQLRCDVVAKPRKEMSQCLTLQRICPDAKVQGTYTFRSVPNMWRLSTLIIISEAT